MSFVKFLLGLTLTSLSASSLSKIIPLFKGDKAMLGKGAESERAALLSLVH
jgi:hypothetical protein